MAVVLLSLGLAGYALGFYLPIGALTALRVARQTNSYVRIGVDSVRVRNFPGPEQIVPLDRVDRFVSTGTEAVGLRRRDGTMIAVRIRLKGGRSRSDADEHLPT